MLSGAMLKHMQGHICGLLGCCTNRIFKTIVPSGTVLLQITYLPDGSPHSIG